MITYTSIIIFSWAALIVVWFVLAFNVKRDIDGGYSSVWKQYLLYIVGATLIIMAAVRIGNEILIGIFSPSIALGWIGAIFTVLGIAFAIWARFSLGRNWSARLAVKEKHELVTTGPYAYVRHPLYTGVIVAALGTMLTGMVFGVGVFIIACIIVPFRVKKEERDMLELFPNEYPTYQKRIKRLVPFVW